MTSEALVITNIIDLREATDIGAKGFAPTRMQASNPNYRRVVSRIQALDLRLVTAKRQGSKKARELLGPVAISTLQPEHPMDVLQIDHTPVDVIVVDQQKGLQ